MASLIGPLLAALAAGWASVLTVAPYLPVPVAGFLYLFGSVICHQMSERSFHLDGEQLPVCARCLGVYAGAGLGSTLFFVADVGRAFTARLARRKAAPYTDAVLFGAAAPTLLTVILEWSGLWHPSNVVRAAAGAALGAVLALVVMATLQGSALHYETCPRRRPIASRPPPSI